MSPFLQTNAFSSSLLILLFLSAFTAVTSFVSGAHSPSAPYHHSRRWSTTLNDVASTNSNGNNNNNNGASSTSREKKDDRVDAIPVTFVADTRLPTGRGDYRLRAYRVTNNASGGGSGMGANLNGMGADLNLNPFNGKEPVVIYYDGAGTSGEERSDELFEHP